MFESPLMKDWGYRTAGLYTVEDLDKYDSKLVRELMTIHDQIHLMPVRGVVPEYRGQTGREVYRQTAQAIEHQLLPAVSNAVEKLTPKAKTKVQQYVREAVRCLSLGRNAFNSHQMDEAGYQAETALSKLHEAIEVIRNDTRKGGKPMLPRQRETKILDVIND